MTTKFPHKYYLLIKKYFRGDEEKTLLWFKTKNPSLGGKAPLDMIRDGRSKKLIDFIQSSLDGNYP